MLIKLHDENFDELINSKDLTIVDFYADWCGPCKMLGGVFEDVLANDRPDLKLVKVNVDNFEEISARYKIYSIPAIFAFKEGKVVDSFIGYQPKANVLRFIDKNK
jgi:thioredoxin 1